MSFVSRISPFKSVRVQTFGGGEVKIKINRDLLNPVGKDIIGTLRINGKTVYIPQNVAITIGSSPKSDIRILDKQIGIEHLMITSNSEDIQVHHLCSGKKVVIGDIQTGEQKTLSSDNTEEAVTNNSIIGLSLTGNNRHLFIKLEAGKDPTEALKTTLARQLETRLPIEQVSPEQALSRIEDQQGLSEPLAIDPKLVEGTIFSEVRTITSLLNTYKNALEYVERKAWRRDLITLFSMLPIGGVLGALFIPYSLFGTNMVFPGVFFGAIAGTFASISTSVITRVFMQKKINNQFYKILKGLSSKEIYNLLKLEEDPEIREKILCLLEISDLPKALTARELLGSEARENTETQSSLPAGEARAALPPAEESLSDALAKSELKAAQVRQAQVAEQQKIKT